MPYLKNLKKRTNLKGVKVPKKEGENPKGGKIIKQTNKIISSSTNVKENIILHLKCKTEDLMQSDNLLTSLAYQPNVNKVQPYNTNDIDMNLLTSMSLRLQNQVKNQPKQTIELTVSSSTKQKQTRAAKLKKRKIYGKK